MAEKIDLNTLPKGLTKEEFTALPNFKKIRSFFTWAGVVSIGSGILICSEIGKTAERVFQAGGSYDDMSRLWAVNLNMLFMIFDIVMGILLLKKKTTKMAYSCYNRIGLYSSGTCIRRNDRYWGYSLFTCFSRCDPD